MIRRRGLVLAVVLGAWWIEVSPTFARPPFKRRPPRLERGENWIHTPAGDTADPDWSKADVELLKQMSTAGKRGDWRQVQQLWTTSGNRKTPICCAAMHAALRCKCFGEGATIFQDMGKRSAKRDLLSFNLGIKLLAKSGQVAQAEQVGEEAAAIFGMDPTLAAARLVAAADMGNCNAAFDLLADLRQSQVSPDVGHFTTAMRACRVAKGARHQEARRLFEQMRDSTLEPDVGAFTSMAATYTEAPLEYFLSLQDEVKDSTMPLNPSFVEELLRKLLLLQDGRRMNAGDLESHMQRMDMDRLLAASGAIAMFKQRVELTKLCKNIDGALKATLP